MANEKRLIDAKAGKKVFSAIAQPAEYKGVIHMVVPISEIDKLPAIDAVEVVRCRDCAVPHNKYTGCPELNGLVTPPDFYCPFGERKDGGGNG